ncbi:glycoside hydrolase family 26 protein, partial [Piromyces sp. E2]
MNSLSLLLLCLSFVLSTFAKKVYYEAEDGKLNGVTVFKSDLSGFSGTGYVGRFENPGNSVTVTVDAKENGMYDLSIIYCANMGQKINSLTVNGQSAGDITFTENTGFEELNIGAIYLKAGKNTIGLTASWGWMWVDAFVINDTPNAAKDVTSKLNPTLVNPKAIPAAKKLYDFLKSNYGKRILSGQVGAAGQAGDEGQEIQRIQKATGKLPAVWNMDFIFESND